MWIVHHRNWFCAKTLRLTIPVVHNFTGKQHRIRHTINTDIYITSEMTLLDRLDLYFTTQTSTIYNSYLPFRPPPPPTHTHCLIPQHMAKHFIGRTTVSQETLVDTHDQNWYNVLDQNWPDASSGLQEKVTKHCRMDIFGTSTTNIIQKMNERWIIALQCRLQWNLAHHGNITENTCMCMCDSNRYTR